MHWSKKSFEFVAFYITTRLPTSTSLSAAHDCAESSCLLHDAPGFSQPRVLLQTKKRAVKIFQTQADYALEAGGGVGETASFDEDGYQAVAQLCCTAEMDIFIRRLISHMGLEICNEYGLLGFVPWYSCEANAVLLQAPGTLSGIQSYKALHANLLASVPPVKCAFVAKPGMCPKDYTDCHGDQHPHSHRRRACQGNPSITTATTTTNAVLHYLIVDGRDDGKNTALLDQCKKSVEVVAGTVCCGAAPSDCEALCRTGTGHQGKLAVNYSEAVGRCGSKGKRLCTPQELQDAALSKTCNLKDTSCKYHNFHVWTSQPCDPEAAVGQCDASDKSGSFEPAPSVTSAYCQRHPAKTPFPLGQGGVTGQGFKRGFLFQKNTHLYTAWRSIKASWFHWLGHECLQHSTSEWANTAGAEWVPHLAYRRSRTWNGSKFKMCTIVPTWRKLSQAELQQQGICTVDDIVETIQRNIDSLCVKPKYLMAIHEPWSIHKANKIMNTTEAADLWRFVYMHVAAKLKLGLVPPAASSYRKVGGTLDGGGWFIEFVQRCWALKDDPEAPCDIDTIKAISIHQFNCKEEKWKREYSETGGLRELFIDNMVGVNGRNWTEWISALPYWATATSCNQDTSPDPNAITGPTQYYQCLILTGAYENTTKNFGKGYINWIDGQTHHHRWATFPTVGNSDADDKKNHSAVVTFDDQLSLVGKAQNALEDGLQAGDQLVCSSSAG